MKKKKGSVEHRQISRISVFIARSVVFVEVTEDVGGVRRKMRLPFEAAIGYFLYHDKTLE